ncbi:MAG TPA: SprT-like domain-containing protein [Bacteroidia bacterium]|nr:SprT-like domain-containing protein [Bacteroidia bacterium]
MQVERNKSILKKYIPAESVDIIALWIYQFDFKLKIKKGRSTKYGDYRPPVKGQNHQITINHDMNKYAFLITLVHEIAHLANWQENKNAVKPHGNDWKNHYKKLITPFMKETIFPVDVISALHKYMENPAASSCSDPYLFRTLKNYDEKHNGVLLEKLPINSVFSLKNGRLFKKGEKIRTRYQCLELKTNKIYLFAPIAEVFLVQEK